ncbi:MAG: DUF4349 domain-containing protein [Thermoleophilia bacterium]|nr:DUF4349 domain-containing protein [Thermoleophilia bacterium]
MPSPENGARLHEVLEELRASAPPAPEHLRARIDQLAAAEPAGRHTFRERISLRGALLVLAPAVVVIGLGAAVIGGISGAGRTDEIEEAAVGRDAESSAPTPRDPARNQSGPAAGSDGSGPAPSTVWKARATGETAEVARRRAPSAGLPPARRRAQDYRASLRLRVDGLDNLSRRTKDAIRMTRGWGGYVVSVDYDIPGRQGDARLELRVPVQHVQAAVQRFSELGTILAEDIAIRDVQGQLDRYTRDLLALRERIAKLRADLREPGLSERERAHLELRLARARRALAERSAERAALARRASFATVSLTLTTRQAAVATDSEGRVERALEDAGSVLAKEVAFGLYALIVAAPFLVLAAAAFFATRVARRRADERLLERI